MQIHELNLFSGTPGDTDYLPISNGSKAFKVPARRIYPTATQEQINAGSSTVPCVITPKLLHDYVSALFTDYVTSQGTSGSWKYRKWKSGKIEAWYKGSASFAVTVTSSAYGGYRSDNVSISIPSGIFTAAPGVVLTKNSANSIDIRNANPASATQITCYGSSAESITATISFSIYAWQN